jgi:hypothetical protein
MSTKDKQLLYRIPIFVSIGIALSIFLKSLALSTPMFFISFFIIAAGIVILALAFERYMQNKLKIGNRVKIIAVDSAFEQMQGVVIRKEQQSTLPFVVKIDGYDYPTLFCENELELIKE